MIIDLFVLLYIVKKVSCICFPYLFFVFFFVNCFLYRKNLFMKEKLNKKEQHKLYTLFTIYRSNIVGKTNQFKHNSLFINLFCLQYYLSQWSWPKIDTLLLRI